MTYNFRVMDLIADPCGKKYQTFETENDAKTFMRKARNNLENAGYIVDYTTKTLRVWPDYNEKVIVYLMMEIHVEF